MKKKIQNILLLRSALPAHSKIKHPQGHRYPYILKYIESILRQKDDYSVKLIDLEGEIDSFKKAEKVIKNLNYDLLILSSTIRDLHSTINIASIAKDIHASTITVCVGQGPTACPNRYTYADSPIDFIISGDAEIEILSLMKKFEEKTNLKDLIQYYKNKNKTIASAEDLDRLPVPYTNNQDFKRYHHIYPIKMNKKAVWGHILTSRGCPYPCSFCTEMIRETTGSSVRLREAKKIVDELELLMKQGVNLVVFDDDNFTTSHEHIEIVCKEIIARSLDIRWIAHARVDNLTENLVQLMKKAGCVLLRFGIESGSNRVLKILKKTTNEDWVKQAEHTFKMCRNVGIARVALFIIGNPTETETEILKSINLAQKLDPDILQVSFFTFYPDTKIYKDLNPNKEDLNFANMHHFSNPTEKWNPSEVNSERLCALQKKFYAKILFRPKYIWRHFIDYGLYYLNNPGIMLSLSKIIKYMLKRPQNLQYDT